MQVEKVLHLHSVEELGEHDQGVSQAARICAVIGLHARTVQTVVKPERVNGKFVSVDAVFDELDGFGGRLEHTLTIRSSAFWVEH